MITYEVRNAAGVWIATYATYRDAFRRWQVLNVAGVAAIVVCVESK